MICSLVLCAQTAKLRINYDVFARESESARTRPVINCLTEAQGLVKVTTD